MRCEEAMELLSAKLDGELDPQTDAALSRHLQTCEDCRRVWAAYCEIDAGIAALEAEPSAELYQGVMEIIRTAPAVKPAKKRRPMWGVGTAVAAAAVLFLLIGTGTVSLPKLDMAENAAGTVAEDTEVAAEMPAMAVYEEAAAPAEAQIQPAAGEETAEVEAEQILPWTIERSESVGTVATADFDLEVWLEEQSLPVLVFEPELAEVEALLRDWEALDWLEVPTELAQWQTVADGVWSCEIDAALAEAFAEQYGGAWYAGDPDAGNTLIVLICKEKE